MRFRSLLAGVALTAAALSLAGCSTASTHRGTVDDPIPVREKYKTTTYELPAGFLVTCISRGSGRSSVLSCVEAAENAVDAVPLVDSPYDYSFRKLEDGRMVVCLSKRSGLSAVISCVPYLA